jgi:hypothetical protein
MDVLRAFGRFWIDFVVGDAWEVAVGLAVTLVVIAFLADQGRGGAFLGFILVVSVLVCNWIALRRATNE